MTYSMTDLHEHIRSLERDLIREGKARKQLEADHAALLRLVEALPKILGEIKYVEGSIRIGFEHNGQYQTALFNPDEALKALLAYRQGRP